MVFIVQGRRVCIYIHVMCNSGHKGRGIRVVEDEWTGTRVLTGNRKSLDERICIRK